MSLDNNSSKDLFMGQDLTIIKPRLILIEVGLHEA